MSKNKVEQKKRKEEPRRQPTEEEEFTAFMNQLISNAVLQHEGIKQATVEVIKSLGQRIAQEIMIKRTLERKIAELEKKNKK
ncbi:MAG: hypothetical protein V3V41_00200 [Candidatus Heimdallarchaeota archaeon]